jgi:uncharacterized protein YyaL (SSP411 family)
MAGRFKLGTFFLLLMTAQHPSGATNRLIHEKSPYLLQHAQNPVDWYPWGPEAFEKARKENKPILVSIGYSTCHWCHVMEKESYEDPSIGALMNESVVSIKVDREERPDVDKIYITAVSAMTGSAGWPLNVFLTPDLKPFFGGTYFPPSPRWGQPAWRDVVKQISAAWKDPAEHQKLLSTGHDMSDALKRYMSVSAQPAEGEAAWLDKAYNVFAASFDSSRGGFGSAPKFPMPVYQNFLLRYYARTGEKHALEMVLVTLREMSRGGIYDHLGGGFSRYSTDADWHVPHFEKMLYDNAQITVNLIEAYQATQDPEWRRIAQETLGYISRDMTHPEGGFYSAEDADSLATAQDAEKKEGAFYVWDKKELLALLTTQEAELFCFRYGVRDDGNARQDPHGEFTGKNILYAAHPLEETARHFNVSMDQAAQALNTAKTKLFSARIKRPRPHLDDKILSGWNGLMLSAYVKAAQVFEDSDALKRAQHAAFFLKKYLYDPKTKMLYRSWRDGAHSSPGIADDYAFVVQGLLDLYEADFNVQWLVWAEELTEQMNLRFYDTPYGGYFMTATDQDPNLLLRVKEDADNVEPSASSVAALNLLRLAQLTDRTDFAEAARKTLQAYGSVMRDQPRSLPQMLSALDFSLTEPRQLVIAGAPNDADVAVLLRAVRQHFIPVKTVLLADQGSHQQWLSRRLPQLSGMKPIEGHAVAYVCSGHTCKPPTADPQKILGYLGLLAKP